MVQDIIVSKDIETDMVLDHNDHTIHRIQMLKLHHVSKYMKY